jgi:hypothetical protein
LHPDHSVAPDLVVDDNCLADLIAQGFGDRAAYPISCSASREWHHQSDRPIGKLLCAGYGERRRPHDED